MNTKTSQNVLVIYRGTLLWFAYHKGSQFFALNPNQAENFLSQLRESDWKIIYGDDPEYAKISS